MLFTYRYHTPSARVPSIKLNWKDIGRKQQTSTFSWTINRKKYIMVDIGGVSYI